MQMVDVGGKERTERVAVASAFLQMRPATLRAIREGRIEKGDVLAAARLAGVIAAKRTPDVIPLCHPIALSGVQVEVAPRKGGLAFRVTVRTVDRTGVEMEALTAASAAALTVYDMCKSRDRGMALTDVRLELKSGGRIGTWTREAAGRGAGEAAAPPAAPASPAPGLSAPRRRATAARGGRPRRPARG
jgi:cyclic pyranopterin phosphate synthase